MIKKDVQKNTKLEEFAIAYASAVVQPKFEQ